MSQEPARQNALLDTGSDWRPPVPFTLDDWARMPEDEPGEFIDGCLEEEEMPDARHEVVVMWLARVVGNWLEDLGDGFILGSEAKYQVLSTKGRKPDATIFFPGHSPAPQGLLREPPDIAIEVVSPSPRDMRRDRIEKLGEYASFGIRWYWIVDPQLRSFEVLELRDRTYAHVATSTRGRLAVPGCPSLILDLDALWSKLDRLDSKPG